MCEHKSIYFRCCDVEFAKRLGKNHLHELTCGYCNVARMVSEGKFLCPNVLVFSYGKENYVGYFNFTFIAENRLLSQFVLPLFVTQFLY